MKLCINNFCLDLYITTNFGAAQEGFVPRAHAKLQTYWVHNDVAMVTQQVGRLLSSAMPSIVFASFNKYS